MPGFVSIPSLDDSRVERSHEAGARVTGMHGVDMEVARVPWAVGGAKWQGSIDGPLLLAALSDGGSPGVPGFGAGYVVV